MSSSRRNRDPLFQKKSLGQVFLNTNWPVDRMVEKIQDLKIERALEIGPGPGILTRGLMTAGVDVTAVEKDDRFAERLMDQSQAWPGAEKGKLSVVNADILKFSVEDWAAASAGRRSAIVGNIPYNISSPIVLKCLEVLDHLEALLFMTQLEFAERVAADSGNKDYGSLTVYTQLRADVNLEFEVERNCFTPPPKVDSAVILLTPRQDKLPPEVLKITEQVTRAAFSQRRKKLRNSIRSFLEGIEEADVPMDLERRADSLSPPEFVALAQFIAAHRQP